MFSTLSRTALRLPATGKLSALSRTTNGASLNGLKRMSTDASATFDLTGSFEVRLLGVCKCVLVILKHILNVNLCHLHFYIMYTIFLYHYRSPSFVVQTFNIQHSHRYAFK